MDENKFRFELHRKSSQNVSSLSFKKILETIRRYFFFLILEDDSANLRSNLYYY